jgi:hypothetical protein
MRGIPFCIFLLLLAINGNAQQVLHLAKKGKALSTIVLPENADELEQKAARELQSYLQKIGDVEMAIGDKSENQVNIFVRQNPEIDKHQVAYYTEEGDFYIEGGSPKSTLYAVYTFLEKEMDCRFYSPAVEKIPGQESISIPKGLNYRYTPEITTRTVHSRLFYENPDFADKLKVTHEAFPTYVPVAKVHTFHRFMPADTFYPTHPEYYALRNGKRLTTQLCLTNEAVFEIVKDSVASQLARYPEAEVISVSQDDNTQYCQCKQCEAIHEHEGTPAGSMIAFVNRLADEFPEKQISTLAYQYTRKAPKYLKPKKNVLITLCSIECDRSAPITKKCTDFSADLKEWSAISDNIRIWDYTTQFTNFLAPFPNLHTLKPNIELFRDNNAKWVFEQHSNNPSELFELRSYLTAQLLWQPDAAANAIRNDFLNGYYEAAAPFIDTYIKTVHEALQADSTFVLFLYGDPSQGFDSFLSRKRLATYDSLYNEAAKAVAGQEALARRVNVARLSVDYALLEFAKRHLNDAIKKENIAQRLARFEKTCQQANITAMNEMRYTVSEYIETYQRTIERAKINNLAQGKKVKLLTKPKKYANEDPQTLTDGALGGSSFFANWLGFEGNHLEAVIDLEKPTEFNHISTAFLQVTNHLVFFPISVAYYYSLDGSHYQLLTQLNNQSPLTKSSKINDIQYFGHQSEALQARYIKIVAQSAQVAPEWHHGSGLPSWIFIDEIIVSK